jgi:hypothetical protein
MSPLPGAGRGLNNRADIDAPPVFGSAALSFLERMGQTHEAAWKRPPSG